MRAVHVAALVAVEGAQLGAVLDEGARDCGGVGPAPLQLREEDAGVKVVKLLQVPEDGGGGVGGHAELVSVEWLTDTSVHFRGKIHFYSVLPSLNASIYRARQVVVDLGLADMDFGHSTTCPILLGQQKGWQYGLWTWAR